MADPAHRDTPDSLGAVYLAQPAGGDLGSGSRKWRWVIDYSDAPGSPEDKAAAAGVSPGESLFVASAHTEPDKVYDSADEARAAAQVFAQARANADAASKKGRSRKPAAPAAPEAPAEDPPAEDPPAS